MGFDPIHDQYPLVVTESDDFFGEPPGEEEVVDLPHLYQPRSYQRPLWDAMVTGSKKRGILVWHRRAGKDTTVWNMLIYKAAERVGLYFYCFPTYAQGRKIIWEGMTSGGRRMMDFIPAELVEHVNNTEMKITLKNGSIVQIVGVDNYDRLMGTNPVGLIFSEYSIQNPKGWELMRPILAENGGWALFVYTPRGRNHGYALWQAAQRNPDAWFTSILTVDQTRRPNGEPVISDAAIQEERDAGMTDELIRQEFYCSFDTAVNGAYYGKQLATAYEEGRICRIPIEPLLPVQTWWDIGMDDATAIWFVQTIGNEVRVVDYHEDSGESLPHYLSELTAWRQKHDVVFARHVGPHDFRVRELMSGQSRRSGARKLGYNFALAPRVSVIEGIDAVRRMFPRLWFDGQRCAQGLAALAEYTKEWDDETKVFRNNPLHNWTCHGADALRTGAISFREVNLRSPRTTVIAPHMS